MNSSQDHSPQLASTWYINTDHPAVMEFAHAEVGSARDPVERAVRLFYAVRDGIRYTAYGLRMEPEAFRASSVLETRRGWCVTKSVLLAAVSRAAGIPCRLGFANVKNHLATKKLLEAMGTDVFYYHGYNEFWLEGRWVKATVAFNRSLCEKARLLPLEWDGRHDSLYHPFDLEGRRHMEYLHDYGAFDDLPYDEILNKFAEIYGTGLLDLGAQSSPGPKLEGDFEAEIAAEAAGQAPRVEPAPPA